jgi:hypothetical protein
VTIPGELVPAPVPAAERMRNAWQRRAETDYRFEKPWRNVVLGLNRCGFFFLYDFYQPVTRSREPNRRGLALLDAATTFAWNDVYRRSLGEELRPAFERIALHLDVLRRQTTEFRDPGIWLVLGIVARGIAEIVAFVLLDGDLVAHDRAEGAVEAELAAIYTRLGQPLPVPDPSRVKAPDQYAWRIVVTVVTCGLYLLWWFADQQRDGDAHYAVNWPWEDHLAQAVQHLQDQPAA